MWIGDFFRRYSFVLLASTLLGVPAHARPRTRTMMLASAFICASTFATTALLSIREPMQAQVTGSHEVTQIEDVEPLQEALLEEQESGATFSISDSTGAVPFIKVFDKNRIQRLYATRIISTIREKIEDPDVRALIPQTDYLQVEFRELRVERSGDGNAELILRAGPVPMELRQSVPLADLESGHWVNIRFADFVVNEESASVVATVRAKLRYVGDSGRFELSNIQGDVSVSALFGTEKDSATFYGGSAERLDP
ncbi:MAG: hypothetical protein KDD51_04865 [Bdellovibrionales bacterium]|nr:hypothetical protein [Bdellovibrionales bacterium]